jgi:LysM repeat protein
MHLALNTMFFKGRLQMSLLAITIISGVLSLVFAQQGDDPATTTTLVPVETTVTVTTTIYKPPVRYIIQPGDTLFGIASTYLLDMQALMDLNNITNSDHVETGDELIFPPANGFIPVAPSTTMKP